MRIGLFTDMYLPSINGITYVVDITRHQLEALGHEVFIFCPADSVRKYKDEDDHIIRFMGLKGAFFDDYKLSIFFPPRQLRKIREMELDVIQFFTPGQVGLMGVYAAEKTGAVLISQHSTDLAQYIRLYPAVVPGLLMLAMTLPMTFKFQGKDVRELMKIYRPRRVADWGQDIVEKLMAMVYSRCDAVIALSAKSKKQLDVLQREYEFQTYLIPTGVDALPIASDEAKTTFRQEYGIAGDDEVMMYVGRINPEKNLGILIPSLKQLLKTRPKARLVYVGGGEFEPQLRSEIAAADVESRVTLTGPLPRESLSVAYQSAEVFVFPSLTDTQGLVLHEAAQAGCPIVLTDGDVSEVAIEGRNSLVAENDPEDIARCVEAIFEDDVLRRKFGEASKRIAGTFTERQQTEKLQTLYRDTLRR